MSVNKYNSQTGELTTIASGQRTWIGTKEAYEQQKQAGTLPTDCLICITNDEDDTIAEVVTENDPRAVTSGAVFDLVQETNVHSGDTQKFKIMKGQAAKNYSSLILLGYVGNIGSVAYLYKWNNGTSSFIDLATGTPVSGQYAPTIDYNSSTGVLTITSTGSGINLYCLGGYPIE